MSNGEAYKNRIKCKDVLFSNVTEAKEPPNQYCFNCPEIIE